MQRLKNFAISSLIITLLLFPLTTSSQNQPGSSSRPVDPQAPATPRAKFSKTKKPIPNRYIVVLEDNIVPVNATREVRRGRIAAFAKSLAESHGGTVDFIYETALMGFAIELPTEAAARAISNSPRVRWVEEDGYGEWDQAPPSPQPSPPWGLDAIDGQMPTQAPSFTTGRNNGFYGFGANGTGVSAYILDTGINTEHQEFKTPFFSRASIAADCFNFVNCVSGEQTPFFNQQQCVFPVPNAGNNDCLGHGTHVAGTIGGNQYGVAKNVTLRSVKVGSSNGPIISAVIAGVNWMTGNHQANPSTPVVANMSLQIPTGQGVEAAVQNAINQGVTIVVAAGNNNANANVGAPANVADALTVGAVDWNGIRSPVSNWGPGVDLFAPGIQVVSASTGSICNGGNSPSAFCLLSGTSHAAPHVAGGVALYLQFRQGQVNCNAFPIDGSAPTFNANFSTCPDRVARFIKATANLDKLTSSINGSLPSANRFLLTSSLPGPANPIDNNQFFIWTQYMDFLGREPESAGLAAWVNILNNCPQSGQDANGNWCDRIEVSSGFFRSPEFQARGYFIYRFYSTVGRIPVYPEFKSDFSKVSGFLTEEQLEANKVAFVNEFMARAEFQNRYGPTFNNPTAYVNALLQTVGLPNHPSQGFWINGLTNGSLTRAQVLRGLVESAEMHVKYFNEAFVIMSYFGYLRRTADGAYVDWINVMNQTGGDYRVLINGFMNSSEYRRRFGP